MILQQICLQWMSIGDDENVQSPDRPIKLMKMLVTTSKFETSETEQIDIFYNYELQSCLISWLLF